MDLQELLKDVKDAVVVEEFEDDDEGDDVEIDLQNALLLLRDAADLLGTLSHKNVKKWPDVINVYVGKQISKLGSELESFLSDYDMDDTPKKA